MVAKEYVVGYPEVGGLWAREHEVGDPNHRSAQTTPRLMSLFSQRLNLSYLVINWSLREAREGGGIWSYLGAFRHGLRDTGFPVPCDQGVGGGGGGG